MGLKRKYEIEFWTEAAFWFLVVAACAAYLVHGFMYPRHHYDPFDGPMEQREPYNAY